MFETSNRTSKKIARHLLRQCSGTFAKSVGTLGTSGNSWNSTRLYENLVWIGPRFHFNIKYFIIIFICVENCSMRRLFYNGINICDICFPSFILNDCKCLLQSIFVCVDLHLYEAYLFSMPRDVLGYNKHRWWIMSWFPKLLTANYLFGLCGEATTYVTWYLPALSFFFAK